MPEERQVFFLRREKDQRIPGTDEEKGRRFACGGPEGFGRKLRYAGETFPERPSGLSDAWERAGVGAYVAFMA